jgi:hypothetical protein
MPRADSDRPTVKASHVSADMILVIIILGSTWFDQGGNGSPAGLCGPKLRPD